MFLEEATVENEWLSFSKTASINDAEQEATITFKYATLTNEVTAGDLDLYVESVEAINDQASFYLQNAPAMLAAKPAVTVSWNTSKVKFWVVFFAMIYFTGWSLHFMKRYRKTIDYYSDEDYEL
jgi:hypothetical protein